MRRRHVLHLGAALAACVFLSGHTPYRHWNVYRQKHLLIGSCKSDPPGYVLAQRIAQTLASALPESRARVSRAPDPLRIASLLASDQWQVSVLRRVEALDLAAGRGPFRSVGAVPLRGLFSMGEHDLVCRHDFPDRHAWLVSATLTEHAGVIPGGTAFVPDDGAVAVHPGARDHARGAPLPPAPPASDDTQPAHRHAQ